MAQLKGKSRKDIVVRFTPIDRSRPRQITMAVQGSEMSGKSHFLFTAPPPICVLTTEPGKTLNAARHFPDTEIDIAAFETPKGVGLGKLIDTPKGITVAESRQDKETWEEAWAEWQRFIAYHEAAITSGKYRTVGWDKETGIWELCRLAYFGKLLKIKSREYGLPHADMAGLIKMAEKHGVNLVLLRENREAYLNDKPSGRIVGKGFKQTPFLSDVVLKSEWESSDGVPKGFSMEIETCSQDMTLCGDTFIGEEATFPDVAAWVVKGSKKKSWR